MPKSRALPPAADLWELFSYNPLTGQLYWRVPKQGRQVNKPAGTNDNGYRKLVLSRKPYLLHRVVWAWLTGIDPGALLVDHVDLNRANNRWWNLRLVDTALNAVNVPGRGYYCRLGGVGPKPWIVTRYADVGKPASESYATEAEAKLRADEIKASRLVKAVLPHGKV
jgi:hypothetical protein